MFANPKEGAGVVAGADAGREEVAGGAGRDEDLVPHPAPASRQKDKKGGQLVGGPRTRQSTPAPRAQPVCFG